MAVRNGLTLVTARRIRRGIGDNMDNATLAADTGPVTRGQSRLRVGVVAIALVFASLVLMQQKADASPAGSAAVTSVSAAVAAPAAVGAQIDVAALIRSIVCPILETLGRAFANFFGGIVLPIINSLRVAFGCGGISG